MWRVAVPLAGRASLNACPSFRLLFIVLRVFSDGRQPADALAAAVANVRTEKLQSGVSPVNVRTEKLQSGVSPVNVRTEKLQSGVSPPTRRPTHRAHSPWLTWRKKL